MVTSFNKKDLPKRIQIPGYTIAVKPIRKKDKNVLYGCFEPDECTIYVDLDRPEGIVIETLLHETLHAIIWAMGLELQLKKGKDEVFVATMSPVLRSVLKANQVLSK